MRKLPREVPRGNIRRDSAFGGDVSVAAQQGKVQADQPRAEEDPHCTCGADVGAVGNLEIAPELGLRECDEREPRHRAEDGRDDKREEDRHRTEERPDRAHQKNVAHPHRLALERLGTDKAHKPEKPEAEDEPGQRPGDRHQPCGDAVHAVESTGTVPRRPYTKNPHPVGRGFCNWRIAAQIRPSSVPLS